jgi:ribosomal protein L31E
MATTTITLNLKRRLLGVHVANRRKRISTYTKEAIARFAKADAEKIRIDAALNRHLIMNIARRPAPFKVTLERTENRVIAKLHGAPKAPEVAKPEAKKEAGASAAKQVKPAGTKA